MPIPTIEADALALAIARDPVCAAWASALGDSWGSFEPRPDKPEQFDQQSSFVHDRVTMAWLIKGNASGGTEAASHKMVQFLTKQQPPPRHDTPFWVLSNNYEQCINTIWKEKLEGHGHLPRCEYDYEKISWHNQKQGQPKSVPLKEWPGRPGKNWVIEFKSYEQGRAALQAQSIGGFYFTEQFAEDIFTEVFRGCREYLFPGGQFAEFTPIDADLCLWIERFLEHPPDGWKFYRCNTTRNTALAEHFLKNFTATINEDTAATRLTGALATFEGSIYPHFAPSVHCLPLANFRPNNGVFNYRGIDFGASADHPFVCLWGYRTAAGDWYIYDEYVNGDQTRTINEHCKEVIRRHPWPEDEFHGSTFVDSGSAMGAQVFIDAGVDVQNAIKSVFAGINTIRDLLKVNATTNRPRLFICSERCPVTIDQMRRYRWLRAKPKSAGGLNPKAPPPTVLKRDDDCPDALRYMIHTYEKTAGAVPGSAITRELDEPARHSIQLDKMVRAAQAPGWYKK